MTIPTVSVVIPAFNRAQVIARSIQSVLDQDHQVLEIIVVDDASTDDTASVAASLSSDKVRVLRHDTNQFAGAARNTGMRAAQGDLIAFLDSDDLWHPDKLTRQLNALQQEPSARFCIAGVLMKHGRGFREKVLLPNFKQGNPQEALLQFLIGRLHFVTSTLIFYREILDMIGYMDTALRRNQDMDFFVRLLAHYPMVSIERPLADFFANPKPPALDVVARCNQKMLENNREVIESLGKRNSRRIRAGYTYRHGLRHLERGSVLTGAKLILAGLLQYPCQPVQQYLAIPVKLLVRVQRRLTA